MRLPEKTNKNFVPQLGETHAQIGTDIKTKLSLRHHIYEPSDNQKPEMKKVIRLAV